MARLFDRASSENLQVDSAAVSDAPLTMACWYYWTDDSVAAPLVMMWVGDKDSATEYHSLAVLGNITGDPIIATSRTTAGGTGIAQSSSGSTVNTWHHACGVWAAANLRSVYIDGGSKGNETTSLSPAGLDRTAIGCNARSTPDAYFAGRIGEVAVWSAALTDAEVASLAKGVKPTSIRPESLVFYAPLWQDEDEDIVGGLSLTAVNTPSVAAHPRVFYSVPVMVGKHIITGMTYYQSLSGTLLG